MKKRYSKLALSAPQMITFGFAGVILLGAVLLSLPISSQSGEATPFIDALFTATSATCVTGLTTLTTAEHWNLFGQSVILVMIEVGGLGWISLPVLFFFLSRKKIGLKTRIVLQESLNMDQMSGGVYLMRYIIKIAVAIQLIGMALLMVDFVPRFGWAKGTWFSLFHAISSFCNAGFDLFGDSLVGFQKNPWVLSIVMLLIISGGLGFLVWSDLLNYRKRRKFTLHSRIALTVTLGLLIFGTLGFTLTERNAALLAEGNVIERFFNTMFMAVTPRTAGYFSIDYFQMTHAGLILTIILMFIGGTSGSTAGGLKTTTFGVLLIQVKSIFKGRTRAEFAGRTLRNAVVSRSLTLFFITLSLCIVATMILSVTESIPNVHRLGLEYIVFEVVSAFGTVGLTMGLTPDLTMIGKLVIICLMFIGRVGILTVVFSLITKGRQQEPSIKYPEESIMIG
ncbi:TrkH family potassium uptake protein [Enterococcus mediterraneensis]|uniref:TrkH family potassium uptake protein n=1 Tax=Enterococcus mediterraneensis TaxID=2364791 RepID=UPI000F0671D7|nr:TrkH family potassium uptake protein [Enterococcus mediterraneensis]